MDSTPNPANHAAEDRSYCEGNPGTLSNSEWADLEAPIHNRRRHYTDKQLQADPNYSGYTDCWSDEEARTILAELLDRFPLDRFGGFALPPTGLPGISVHVLDEEDLAGKFLLIGMRYAEAVIRNKGRPMHKLWQEAEALIHKIKDDAELRVHIDEIHRSMAEYDARESPPAFVYFIASQSGPIKIGMAVRPMDRLKTLQTSHHEKLELLATCEGGQPQERAYHKRFAAHRLHGEWFERCPEIEAEIASLRTPTGDPHVN